MRGLKVQPPNLTGNASPSVIVLCGGALQVACCFGSAACSLCCAACPSCKNSSASRMAYAALLLMGTVVACIMLNPSVAEQLNKVIEIVLLLLLLSFLNPHSLFPFFFLPG